MSIQVTQKVSESSMSLWRVEYRDWAYGGWYWAAQVWARTESDAIRVANLGTMGKSYRAELVAR
jgi:hypothetical protein